MVRTNGKFPASACIRIRIDAFYLPIRDRDIIMEAYKFLPLKNKQIIKSSRIIVLRRYFDLSIDRED